MFEAIGSPYLVPFDGSFRVAEAPCAPPHDTESGKRAKKALPDVQDDLRELQRKLYATDTWSVLLVFQALDAAGKDGTIRHVMRGINPAGCQVYSFKKPSVEELDHDFLWRSAKALPERGRIGVFNRSYYEEVLVVRVHPGILDGQKLPFSPEGRPEGRPEGDALWQQRFESIADHEKHLARNGTMILKFWLNVSKDEQRRRFLARLDEPEKNWKFSTGDVEERGHFEAYLSAYEDALNATSTPWAPWYAIPADDKPFMRLTVARLFRAAMESLGLRYPDVGEAEKARFTEMRTLLEG